MRLDIGGGTLCAPGHINVDPVHGRGAFKRRIQDGLPDVPDDSAVSARASHVMEHIPSGDERIKAMNEVWRVLHPGAEFTIIVPCVGSTGPKEGVPWDDGQPRHAGWQAYADPTHVSFWWYPESFLYFSDIPAWRPHADYGIRYWSLGEHELLNGWEAHVQLIKPKG